MAEQLGRKTAWDEALEAVFHDKLMPQAFHLVEAWADQRGWPLWHLLELGAVTARRTMPDSSGVFHTGPVIRLPCWNEAGVMTFWQDRTPSRWQRAGLAKWLHPPTAAVQRAARGTAVPPQPPAAGLDRVSWCDALHVVEGMTDYITATLHTDQEEGEGVLAGLGAGAVAQLGETIAALLPAGAAVHIHPHMDEPGVKAAKNLEAELLEVGIRPTVHFLEGHGDLTEAHEAGARKLLGGDTSG